MTPRRLQEFKSPGAHGPGLLLCAGPHDHARRNQGGTRRGNRRAYAQQLRAIQPRDQARRMTAFRGGAADDHLPEIFMTEAAARSVVS